MLLEVQNVKKVYGNKDNQTLALRDINLGVNTGEFVAIMGESGSGKSTLLNIIATLDSPSEGQVLINGTNTSRLSESEVAKFRRERLGFVFQDFNVLDTLSNRDNILLPMVLSNMKANIMQEEVEQIAHLLGIQDLLDKFPYQISGGQCQRVAIGRAIVTQPDILLADEPTGALDSRSSEMIMELFQKINQNRQTILMVTHSIKAAAYASRVLFIKDGIVYHEIYRGNDDLQEFQQRISESLSVLSKRGE